MPRKDFFLEQSQRKREWSRGEYYSVIDVLNEQRATNATLGDVRGAAIEFYRKSAPEMFAGIDRVGQILRNQSAITDQTNEHLANLGDRLSEVNDQLNEIRNIIDFGFETLSVRLDATNAHLKSITSILMSPTRTQSEEYARRAYSSLKNGWYDESLSDFQRVVTLDQLNYAAWYSIGIINAEQTGDTPAAKDALSRAIKYSKPSDPIIYSLSQYHLASLLWLEGDIATATNLAVGSFEANRGNLAAAFLLAELYAAVGDWKRCLKYLEICESSDVIYYLRSMDSNSLRKAQVVLAFFQQRTRELAQFNMHTRAKLAQAGAIKKISDATTSSDAKANANRLLTLFGECYSVLGSGEGSGDYIVQRTIHDRSRSLLQVAVDVCRVVSASLSAQATKLKGEAEQQGNARILKRMPSDDVLLLRGVSWTVVSAVIMFITIALFAPSAFDTHTSDLQHNTVMGYFNFIIKVFMFVVGTAALSALLNAISHVIQKVSAGREEATAKSQSLELSQKTDALANGEVALKKHLEVATTGLDLRNLYGR